MTFEFAFGVIEEAKLLLPPFLLLRLPRARLGELSLFA